jgi:hypothetical protein
MLAVFAAFSVLMISFGVLLAKLYEWRQAVLHGPYAGQEHAPLKGDN